VFRQVSKGLTKTNLKSELCKLTNFHRIDILRALCDLPTLQSKEALDQCWRRLKESARQLDLAPLKNWLQHKERNPWILKSLCHPLSTMRREVWFATPNNTNVGEAAHALSNRAGVKLTLLTAVTVGEKIDTAMLEAIQQSSFKGVRAQYKGHGEMQRFERNQKRREHRREKAQKKAQVAADERDEDINELLHAAINFSIGKI
jgi:hypothetical protein